MIGSILAGVKNAQTPFDLPSHYDLAEALVGFTPMLDAQSEPFSRTRFAVSHFIAMEFAKIAERTAAAGIADRLGEFRAIMEPSSPIPFGRMCQLYLRQGRLWAWWRLRRAMALSPP